MKVLLLVAHPCDDSFTHACAEAARVGLEGAGHIVDTIDLYAERFVAAMSIEERAAYESGQPVIDPMVDDHVRRLGQAEMLVFVYPTWWSGLPAILKGWLERVMVPGVGFVFDDRTGKVRPGLEHVRRIVGISSYGSPRWYVALVNDNGRRVLTRALRMSCGWRTRTTWIAMYALDTIDETERLEHLTAIETKMASL